MTDRENDALRATNIDQAAEIGILRTEKHADAEAIGSQAAEIERLRAALDWYEPRLNMCNNFASEGHNARDDLAKDRGERARAALAQEAQTDEAAATDTEVT